MLSASIIDYGGTVMSASGNIFTDEVRGRLFGTARGLRSGSVTENEKGAANGLSRRMKNEPLNNTKSAK